MTRLPSGHIEKRQSMAFVREDILQLIVGDEMPI
jgi:hypothetical protein